MPRPNNALPEALRPRHLYRHLLRESSYLPPAWRGIVFTAIRSRFRKHRKTTPRTPKYLKDGMSTLKQMRTANSGHKGAMQSLVQKGFARSGLRRYALLRPFLKPQGPDDSSALEALLETPPAEAQTDIAKSENESGILSKDVNPENLRLSKTAFYEKWDTAKIKQLYKSQKTAQEKVPFAWLPSRIKSLDENQDVPQKTIWGKPPGEQLIKAKRSAWWKRNINKMMVPLNKGEWDLLARLSEGAQETGEWKIPERRTPAQAVNEKGKKSTRWNWEDYATKPIVEAERPNTTKAIQRSGKEVAGPYNSQRVITELTPRWYRRVYSQTWQATPYEGEKQGNRHMFAWGQGHSRIVEASPAQLEMFKGVDSKGKKLKQTPSS